MEQKRRVTLYRERSAALKVIAVILRQHQDELRPTSWTAHRSITWT